MKIIKHLLLLVLLTLAFVTFAQHKPFQFGFEGGVNVGWFATDTEEYQNDGVQIGGSWGFVADFFLMEHYSFTTGFDVLYLNGALKYPGSYISPETGNTVDGVRHYDVNLRYLQLPLVLTMKTNEIKEKVRIYGQVGYGLAFRLSAKGKSEFISNEGENVDSSSGSYDFFTFTRSSLIVGFGVEIPLKKSTFVRSGFKFDNCFINMIKSDEAKLRHNFVELSAAVIF